MNTQNSIETVPVKVGVVGVGVLGSHHVRLWKDIENLTKKVKLVGVYDIDKHKTINIANKYECKAFLSLEELADKCQAATVATPTSSHYEVGIYLLKRGLHLLIEKPLTTSMAEAEELIRLATQKNLILQVGHVERFNPVYRYLKQTIPDPRFIEVHRLSPFPYRSTDIGVILDLMIHDLDIVLNFISAPLLSYEAVGVAVLSEREDIANVRLKFANGCIANLTASRISPEKLRKIRVFSGGQQPCYVSVDYQAQSGFIYKVIDESKVHAYSTTDLSVSNSTIISSFGKRKIIREPIPISKEEPLRIELEHFLECILLHKSPEVTASSIKHALQLALQLTEIVQKGNK